MIERILNSHDHVVGYSPRLTPLSLSELTQHALTLAQCHRIEPYSERKWITERVELIKQTLDDKAENCRLYVRYGLAGVEIRFTENMNRPADFFYPNNSMFPYSVPEGSNIIYNISFLRYTAIDSAKTVAAKWVIPDESVIRDLAEFRPSFSHTDRYKNSWYCKPTELLKTELDQLKSYIDRKAIGEITPIMCSDTDLQWMEERCDILSDTISEQRTTISFYRVMFPYGTAYVAFCNLKQEPIHWLSCPNNRYLRHSVPVESKLAMDYTSASIEAGIHVYPKFEQQWGEIEYDCLRLDQVYKRASLLPMVDLQEYLCWKNWRSL